ncbi:MAG: hypothetical protein DCC58_14425, partial [Chloroflexi bacterium]
MVAMPATRLRASDTGAPAASLRARIAILSAWYPEPRDKASLRARIAILSAWYPEPRDNGAKHRLRATIDALVELGDVHVVVFLDETERQAVEGVPVAGVAGLAVLPLPEFHPYSPRAVLAGLSATPRSLNATWDPCIAAQLRRFIIERGIDTVIAADMRTVRYLLSLPEEITLIFDE